MVQKYTFTYSRACGIDIELDIYLPVPQTVSTVGRGGGAQGSEGLLTIPSIVFFHGGGLTWGNRELLPERFKGKLTPSQAFIYIDSPKSLRIPSTEMYYHHHLLYLLVSLI